jgi:hypothetical protein
MQRNAPWLFFCFSLFRFGVAGVTDVSARLANQRLTPIVHERERIDFWNMSYVKETLQYHTGPSSMNLGI